MTFRDSVRNAYKRVVRVLGYLVIFGFGLVIGYFGNKAFLRSSEAAHGGSGIATPECEDAQVIERLQRLSAIERGYKGNVPISGTCPNLDRLVMQVCAATNGGWRGPAACQDTLSDNAKDDKR